MKMIDISDSSNVLRAASPLVLPPLPYAENALEPVITAKTISIHYGKHHKAYKDNLNKLIAGTDYSEMSLEDIIEGTAGRPESIAIFNNAAQTWNHTFYWNSMSPKGVGEPLKLYTLYASPNHRDGVVHHTRAEAERTTNISTVKQRNRDSYQKFAQTS